MRGREFSADLFGSPSLLLPRARVEVPSSQAATEQAASQSLVGRSDSTWPTSTLSTRTTPWTPPSVPPPPPAPRLLLPRPSPCRRPPPCSLRQPPWCLTRSWSGGLGTSQCECINLQCWYHYVGLHLKLHPLVLRSNFGLL